MECTLAEQRRGQMDILRYIKLREATPFFVFETNTVVRRVNQKSIYKLSSGSNLLPLTFVLNSFYSGVSRELNFGFI